LGGLTPAKVVSDVEAQMAVQHLNNPPIDTNQAVVRFSVGQHVRVALQRATFQRVQTQTFSDEVYQIARYRIGNPIVYRLQTVTTPREDIAGWWYDRELLAVRDEAKDDDVDEDEDEFEY